MIVALLLTLRTVDPNLVLADCRMDLTMFLSHVVLVSASPTILH